MATNRPPIDRQIIDNRGFATRYFRDFIYDLWDKVATLDELILSNTSSSSHADQDFNNENSFANISGEQNSKSESCYLATKQECADKSDSFLPSSPSLDSIPALIEGHSSDTQTITAINTPQKVSFNNHTALGMAFENNNKIIVKSPRLYKIDISFRVSTDSSGSEGDIKKSWFWVRLNGADVTVTTELRQTLEETSNVTLFNFIGLKDGDYLEVFWASDSPGTKLESVTPPLSLYIASSSLFITKV